MAAVTGTVYLDGKPLANADVVFQPLGESASPSVGLTSEEGQFEMAFNRKKRGAMLGDHQVRITTARELYDEETGKVTVVPEILPGRYHKTTELNYTVKQGRNDFKINLTSDPKQPGVTGKASQR